MIMGININIITIWKQNSKLKMQSKGIKILIKENAKGNK
jgi:hypothetical protein